MKDDTCKEECCVCYESTKKEDFRVMNPCGHQICTNCMKKYIVRRLHVCPMCRGDFETGEHVPEYLPLINTYFKDLMTPPTSNNRTILEMVRQSPMSRDLWTSSLQLRDPGVNN